MAKRQQQFLRRTWHISSWAILTFLLFASTFLPYSETARRIVMSLAMIWVVWSLILGVYMVYHLTRKKPKPIPKKAKPKKKKPVCKKCNDRGYRILNGQIIPCKECREEAEHDEEVTNWLIEIITDIEEE